MNIENKTVESISISGSSLLKLGNYHDLTVSVVSSNSSETIYWSCDDPDIISFRFETTTTSGGISKNSMDPRHVGQTIVRARTLSGLEAEHIVYVKDTELIEEIRDDSYSEKIDNIYINGVLRFLAYSNENKITFRNLTSLGMEWSYSPESAYKMFFTSYDKYVYVVYYDRNGGLHIDKIDVLTQNILVSKVFTPSTGSSYYRPKCSANKHGLMLSSIMSAYVFDSNLNQLSVYNKNDFPGTTYIQWAASSLEYHYIILEGHGYLKINSNGEISKTVNLTEYASMISVTNDDVVFISTLYSDKLYIYINDILTHTRDSRNTYGALMNLPDKYSFVYRNGFYGLYASINKKPDFSYTTQEIYKFPENFDYEIKYPLGMNKFGGTRYVGGNIQRVGIFKSGSIGGYFTMSVKFNNDNITGRVGETQKALITYEPSNSTETDFYYYVEDDSIADVDMQGNVTFKKIGVTKLVCLEVNSRKKAEIELVSLTNVVSVTGITLNHTSINGFVGDNYILKANIEPLDSTNQNVTWNSSNVDAVHVGADGVLTLKKAANSVVITCTTEDGGHIASCTVSVRPVLVSDVILDRSQLNIEKGKSLRLNSTVYPMNATDKTLRWSTNSNNVAIVDSNGVITAMNEGECVVTSTSMDGSNISSSCNIKVLTNMISVTDVILDQTKVDVNTGSSHQLNVTVLPQNASIKDVIWSSSDDAIATVNNGLIMALKKGSCVISAISVDGDIVSNCVVTIRDIISTSITLNKQNISVEKNKLYQLNAIIQPDNTTNKSILWSSSDDTIATVTSTGLVRGMSIGKCRITARAIDSNLTATCNVDVIAEIFPVQSVSLNKDILELSEMTSSKLEYTIIPSNASNKNVTWMSSNTSVATVDAFGNVYGFGAGECIITCTTEDGNKVDSCSITVRAADSIFESIDIITDTSIINNKMTRVGIKFKTKSDLPKNVLFNAVVNYVGKYKVRDIQLEKGNVMTDVSNSVYETNTKIEKVKERIKSAELKLTPDGIKSIVSENFYDKTNIDESYSKKSEVEQLAGSITSVVTEVSKHNGQISNMESKIEQTAGQIASKVSADDVSSIIRQSPNDIRIGFNDISDSVVINSGGLTVNQGSIACDTLTTPSGHDPIIKLFPNGSQHCSIDATAYGEGGGRGDAIRMKWNSGNYYLINDSGAEVYLNYNNSPRYGFYPSAAYLKPNYIGVGEYGANINTNGGSLRLWTDSYDTGIRVNSNGNIDFVYNGMTKHQFLRDGSKYGGSIEVEGVSYGMSPIDSPQMLIEDVLFDVKVDKKETKIYLDDIYRKSVSKYSVFPSNGKVEVVEKCDGYFIVKGYDCICDFRVVGKRVGRDNIYFNKMK